MHGLLWCSAARAEGYLLAAVMIGGVKSRHRQQGMGMTTEKKSDKIAVITVHGTGDGAPSVAGEKWWQQGSKFTQLLEKRLTEKGVGVDVIPHQWSGANSALEREKGGDGLADMIKRLDDEYAGIHLIGHSHGGNVANIAADLLGWGRKKKAAKRIASLTTVGTPFFKTSTGPAESFGGFMFFWITIFSAILFALAIVLWISATVFPNAESQQARAGVMALFNSQEAWFVWAAAAIMISSMAFMLRLAIEGIRRIFRPSKQAKGEQRVFAIWHRNDEAISFLQNVEQLPIEPFPKGALFRGSRNKAITWGVRGVLLSAAAGFFFLTGNKSTSDSAAQFWFATMIGLLLAPLTFSVVYLGYRYIVGLALEVLARKRLNGFIESTLKGLAFGKDGDQRISSTSVESHTLQTIQLVLEGPVAERMQVNSSAAASKLIEKYRWSLFTVGADTNASVTSLSTDAMTWDSLIHTTYFDQPEMADTIGDYIAQKAKGA